MTNANTTDHSILRLSACSSKPWTEQTLGEVALEVIQGKVPQHGVFLWLEQYDAATQKAVLYLVIRHFQEATK